MNACILMIQYPLLVFVVPVIFSLSEYYEIVDQFEAFYCCVGLWTSFFLFLSAIFNMSKIMKYCTRSTEEIFALFISIAFLVYAIKDATHGTQIRKFDLMSYVIHENTFIFGFCIFPKISKRTITPKLAIHQRMCPSISIPT